MKSYQGKRFLENFDGNIAIILAEFNFLVGEKLLQGALSVLERSGVSSDSIHSFRVPGAFEIPLMAKNLAKSKEYSGIITLGAIIKGETSHFDFIAGAVSNGVLQVSLEQNLPIVFGVLTTHTIEEALDRAGLKAGNQGASVAQSLVEMLSILQDR